MRNSSETGAARFRALLGLAVIALWTTTPSAMMAAMKAGEFHAQGPSNVKRIALTFDDGPGPETDKFLALLDRYQVKATFFMEGQLAAMRPDLVKKVASLGHEVASHTSAHTNYNAHYKSIQKSVTARGGSAADAQARARRDLVGDMQKTRAILEKNAGSKVVLCRMPHGISGTWINEAAREVGHTLVNWTYGADWNSGTAEQLLPGYLKAVRPGAILLMHDGGKNRAKTLTIAEAVIKEAKAKGLEIVTVSQLLTPPAAPASPTAAPSAPPTPAVRTAAPPAAKAVPTASRR